MMRPVPSVARRVHWGGACGRGGGGGGPGLAERHYLSLFKDGLFFYKSLVRLRASCTSLEPFIRLVNGVYSYR